MICPLCGKETGAAQFCTVCGGDIQWARANEMDSFTAGAGMVPGGGVINQGGIPGLRPELAKNPVLQQMAMARWVESTNMPDWLKAEVKQKEKALAKGR